MGLQLEALPHLVDDRLDLDFDERLELVEPDDPRPLRSGHQHLHTGRGLSHAIDLGNRAGRVEVRVGRVVDLGVLLRHEQNLLVVVHREADRGDRRPPPHRQRDDQLGEDDVVAQRHQREPAQPGILRRLVGHAQTCAPASLITGLNGFGGAAAPPSRARGPIKRAIWSSSSTSS